MRTILLSFDEKWYPALRNGDKIFEHRKRFCDACVRAYIYLGKPRQEIVAEICLDKRELLSDWLETYKNDKEACERINDFMTRNKYAMKVLWLKEIEPIPLASIKQIFSSVTAPMSFHDLDKKKDVLAWIDQNKIYTGYEIDNDFSSVTSNLICIL